MWGLIRQLTVREIAARYRGTFLGLVWSVLTPMFMLAVFTFFFSVVMRARWSNEQTGTLEFSVILFAGMIVFNLFAEVINRSPMMITAQPNLVKKIVFPVEILPVVALGSALIQASISFVILILFQYLVGMPLHRTAVLVPLILLPTYFLTLGLAWLFAALGVYVRDVGQIVPPVVMALMFLTPVFYPASALPEWIRPMATSNPLAFAVEAVRGAVAFGTLPDPFRWIEMLVLGLVVAGLGYAFFQKTRKGFADVL